MLKTFSKQNFQIKYVVSYFFRKKKKTFDTFVACGNIVDIQLLFSPYIHGIYLSLLDAYANKKIPNVMKAFRGWHIDMLKQLFEWENE